VEARAPDGSTFHVERALDIVRAYYQDPAEQIVQNLYAAVRAFTHNLPPEDDITAVVLKIEPMS
jgi:serine phosphatase RsbU (regulator of sigma subunit)